MVFFLTPPYLVPHDLPHGPSMKAELPIVLLFVYIQALTVWYTGMNPSTMSPSPPRLRSTHPLSEHHYVLCMLGNILVYSSDDNSMCLV